jgi:hypothetical protein
MLERRKDPQTMNGQPRGIRDDATGVFDIPGAGGDSNVLRMVSLTLRADKEYLPLARTSAMHVGALLAFPLARVADLRLAVDEACISFLDGAAYRNLDLSYAPCAPPETLELAYDRHDTTLHVILRGTAPSHWPDRDELGWAMLETLVSEVRAEVRGGVGELTLIDALPTARHF